MRALLITVLLVSCADTGADVQARIRLNVVERQLDVLEGCLSRKMLLADSVYSIRIGIQTCMAKLRNERNGTLVLSPE